MEAETGGMLRRLESGRFRIEHPLAVNVKDGSVLVYVPAGEFDMGWPEDCVNYERKRHRVTLEAYWIGVYTVSNEQYLGFMKAAGHRAPGDKLHDDPELASHPVVNVSWDDARAYAAWAGCELASEAQWERACRGPLGLEYPWGHCWDPTRCANSGNKGSRQTTAAYEYPKGASGWGTYQQSGNVWEWSADWHDPDYCTLPGGGSIPHRVIRGGSYARYDPNDFRAARRPGADPKHSGGGDLGFRLIRSA